MQQQPLVNARRRFGRRLLASAVSALTVASGALVVTAAAAPPAGAAGFGAGNVVVLRVGTGTAALTNAATAVFLDEYTPSGTLVQSIPMPTAVDGDHRPLTMSGTATSEGALNRSADGRFLVLAGYGAVPGTASVAGTATSAVPRVIGRVDAGGAVDTTTRVTDAFNANNVRGATSDDGERFWAAGANGGVRYVMRGSTGSSTQVSTLSTVVNFRVPAIFGGQLYVSSQSGAAVGVNRVGSGLPATAGSDVTNLVPAPNAYAFVLLDRSPAVPGVDTLYVADDSASPGGGVLKYSSDGSTWTARGSIRPNGEAARGLTGAVLADGSVQLYATTSTTTRLYRLTDTAAYDAPLSAAAPELVVTPAANTVLRAVAFAPVASSATAPTITTQPQGTVVTSGSTATLTVTATGTAPLAYQWYQGAAGDTSTPVGSDSPSFTTPPLSATTSYWVRVTNTAGTADSATATVTVTAAPPSNTAPTITPNPVQPLGLTLGDPGNPPAVRTVTVGDAETAAGSLAVTVSSSNPAVATGSATGTGAVRTIGVNPLAQGYATLTVTVSDGELTTSTTMAVAVSPAGPAGAVNLYASSDASTAVDLGGGTMVVGDDETNALRIYSRTQSSYPVATVDLRAAGLALPDPGLDREIDIEAAARSGSTIYWVGSQGQNTSGNNRLNRRVLFSTNVSGSGAGATLSIGGSYHGLRDDLVAWDQSRANVYGLAAAAAQAPEPSGLNLEGAEFAPDGTTLYLGLRSPLTSANKAIVVPLTNVAALVAANPTTGVSASFGTPIEWDLGGRGVREIRKNAANQYVIVAGPTGASTGAAGAFRLYTWNGNPASAPVLRSGSLDALAASGSVESIVEVPSSLGASSLVQFLTDSGDTIWYGDGVINKDLTTTEFKKVVAASLPIGAGPACSADDVPVGTVQGTTDTSPLVGQTVTVEGVVVGDYEGPAPNLRGFYLQDGGDLNPATSDGVFVFNNLGGTSPDLVSLGQVVQVTGTVSEFQGQTQVSATVIEQCGRTGSVTPTDLTLPRATADDLEPYEGMLVRFPQTLTVTEHFQLGRFGQVVVSSGGRLRQPTDRFRAGDPGVATLQAANQRNRLIVDDAQNGQNPDPIVFGRNGNPLSATNTLRGGDTLTGAVGVLTFTWAGNAASGNAYRLRPVNALNGSAVFLEGNPRPTGTPSVGGNLRIASANLLNQFNTFGAGACTAGVGGPPVDCRGAENLTEYQRQLAKTVASLTSLGADVIGVMELENDGYGPTSALAALVDALNAATAPGTWAFVDVDAATGVVNAAGTDAIKVGLLYRPGAVTPVAGKTFTHPGAATFERIPVAQTFRTSGGALVTVVVNHFKSKSGCPASASDPDADQGDGQGCWNPRRVAQATALEQWLRTTVVPAAGTGDVAIVGDLNSYAGEDPIAVLEQAGYVNLARTFVGEGSYSYVFDGQWGSLDYVLASPSLRAKATGAAEVHVNADEPSVLDYNTNFKSAGQIALLYAPDRFRSSDHDPLVAGFTLPAEAQVTVTSSNPNLLHRGSVSWTATVAAATGSPTPTGTVQFAIDGVPFGAPVPLVNGVATSATTTALPPGASTITATYGGDAVTLPASGTYVQAVRFNVAFTMPTTRPTANAGSTIPIHVVLTDALGPVPAAVGQAWLAQCRVRVSVSGVQTLAPTCPLSYDAATGTYNRPWNTARNPTGVITVTVAVTYPGITTPQQASTSIRLT